MTHDIRRWLNAVRTLCEEAVARPLPATPENIAAAKSFIFGKWRQRAQELGRDDPVDLSDACKFTSLFAATVFGGTMRGNFFHQWVALPDGRTLDLNDEAADVITMLRGEIPDDARDYAASMRKRLPPSLYTPDDRHMRRRDNRQSMASVRPRVQRWADEFLSRRMPLGEGAAGVWQPSRREVGVFMYGGCVALALALHRITGLPLVAIVQPSRDIDEDTETEKPIHVMIKLGDGRCLDIQGARSYDEIVANCRDEHECTTERWSLVSASPNYLKLAIKDDIFDPVSPALAAEARKIAARMVAAYGLERK